ARHAARVLARLAVGRRGELARRFRGAHASAKVIGGELERAPGPGAGLIEEREDDLALEQVAPAAVDDLLREARLAEHAVQRRRIELLGAEHVGPSGPQVNGWRSSHAPRVFVPARAGPSRSRAF